MDEILRAIAVYALPVLFAITLHEAAHGYIAKYFGDNTAYVAGRVTLDPLKHIDLVGTIILPLALLAISKGTFAFGYAKPVPVNFSALRNPRKHSAFVAFAGPFANFVMALGWLILGLVAVKTTGADGFIYEMASAGVWFNLLIFALNLVPIPPLDGGRIVTSMLPPRLGYKFAKIEPYGFFIVIALLVMRMLDPWLAGLSQIGRAVLHVLVYPLKLILF